MYVSTIQTNPSGLIGGTWDRIEGKFLVGISDTDSTFADGATDIGEKEHTLTTAEMPQHTHSLDDIYRHIVNTPGEIASGGGWADQPRNLVSQLNTTNSAGNGLAHNNLPPFLPVYIFKRTA